MRTKLVIKIITANTDRYITHKTSHKAIVMVIIEKFARQWRFMNLRLRE